MTVKLKSPDALFVQIDIQFAAEYGVNEAIIAAKLLRLSEKLSGAFDEAGDKWIRLTLEEWVNEIPFMKQMTIRRTIESLEEKGVILSRNFTGRPKWYRVNPDYVDNNVSVQNEQIPPVEDTSVQSEQIVSVQNAHIICSKCTDVSVQNEQLPIIHPISNSNTISPKGEAKAAPAIPAAVKVYQGLARTYPIKTIWDVMAKTIGDDPENLSFWGEVVFNYLECGWNRRNVKTMLEYYSRREIPDVKKSRSSNGYDKQHNGSIKGTGENLDRQPTFNPYTGEIVMPDLPGNGDDRV